MNSLPCCRRPAHSISEARNFATPKIFPSTLLLSLFIHAITAKSATQKPADGAIEPTNSMQAAQTKDFDQQIAMDVARLRFALRRVNVMNKVNFVNFVNMWKSEKFTAYLNESKASVYFVHFSREYFDLTHVNCNAPSSKLRRGQCARTNRRKKPGIFPNNSGDHPGISPKTSGINLGISWGSIGDLVS